MNKYRPLLAAALFGALTLGLASPGLAHGDDDYGRRGWEHRHHKHHHKHHHRHGRDVVYYGAPVVVHQPAPVIVQRPAYYEPAYYYPPRRDPAVVIGVDIPPLVIPLR